jgi:drug/metabolite transporter (DMT)-like permease
VLNGAAIAVVMIYTFPTFVTLGAWLLFGERIRWSQLLALAIALLGCALLVRAYDPAVLRVSWLGTLIGLGTGMAHAGYVLFSQRAVETKSPWTSLAYTMLFGALTLLVLWLISGALGYVDAAQTSNLIRAVGDGAAPWLGLLVLALGPTLGGYALFTIALRYIPGRVASIVVMLEAPASVLLSVALLGERLEWPQSIGMTLILAGACLPALLAADRRAATKRGILAPNEPLADV